MVSFQLIAILLAAQLVYAQTIVEFVTLNATYTASPTVTVVSTVTSTITDTITLSPVIHIITEGGLHTRTVYPNTTTIAVAHNVTRSWTRYTWVMRTTTFRTGPTPCTLPLKTTTTKPTSTSTSSSYSPKSTTSAPPVSKLIKKWRHKAKRVATTLTCTVYATIIVTQTTSTKTLTLRTTSDIAVTKSVAPRPATRTVFVRVDPPTVTGEVQTATFHAWSFTTFTSTITDSES